MVLVGLLVGFCSYSRTNNKKADGKLSVNRQNLMALLWDDYVVSTDMLGGLSVPDFRDLSEFVCSRTS